MALALVFSVAAPLFADGQRVMTLEAEQRLADLGYWVTKADGKPDPSTRHAIMAFQKVNGLKRTGILNAAVLEVLQTASRPEARYGGPAHIEVDISRQVLFVVDDEGSVKLIVPVSTGNEEKYFDQGKWQVAHTPRGKFKIQHKINGHRKASLGILYYPSYFYGGIAVHGSNSIPPKPASHGCVRVPRGADQVLFRLMPTGMTIYIYE